MGIYIGVGIKDGPDVAPLHTHSSLPLVVVLMRVYLSQSKWKNIFIYCVNSVSVSGFYEIILYVLC